MTFPDLPDVSRDRGGELLLLGVLVLLPLPVRRWKSPASTRRRSFRTGSGITRTGGLAVPEVVAVDQTAGNPLGRPLLVTRELAGSPFPEALAQAGDAGERHALVRAVGAYQARMHGIVMAAPGYFGRQGPFGGDWEHGFQSARAYYRAMEIWWRTDEEAGADPALVAAARAYAGRMRPRVEAAFVPPRFTQANCHAEQFFAARTPGGWAVTGVVDMEVALGGWPLLDVAGIAFD